MPRFYLMGIIYHHRPPRRALFVIRDRAIIIVIVAVHSLSEKQ
jgi:hypothetical protein